MTMKSESPYLKNESPFFRGESPYLGLHCTYSGIEHGYESPCENPLRAPIFTDGLSPKTYIDSGFQGMRTPESPYIYINSINVINRAYIGSYIHSYRFYKHTGSQALTPLLRRLR